jgi:hypothetical protein
MFGNLGRLASVLKNAGQLQESARQVQERLAAARFCGEAGGGQVRVEVNGLGEPIAVRIDPELVRSGDVELLEELTCAALRDAVRSSRAAMQKELSGLLGGASMPGLAEMLGGGP